MEVYRYKENPLIKPTDIKPLHKGFAVVGAFNAGVAEYKDEIILLLRVAERPQSFDPQKIKVPTYHENKKKLELITLDLHDANYDFSDPRVVRSRKDPGGFVYLTSISYIRIASSLDGKNFKIAENAFLYPWNKYQRFGIEDARCTQIGANYYITFSSVSEFGICDSLVSTQDFVTYKDEGNIFPPENKDVIIFPEKIKGQYYALHRPSLKSIGNLDVWIASSPDLRSWGNHKHLFGIRKGNWDGFRIGGGLVPLKTERGWLEIYHGASESNRYGMGAVLLDLADPTKVLARSRGPILEPEASYELNGFLGAVVFGCGALVKGRTIHMYYGVADEATAGCQLNLDAVLAQLELVET